MSCRGFRARRSPPAAGKWGTPRRSAVCDAGRGVQAGSDKGWGGGRGVERARRAGSRAAHLWRHATASPCHAGRGRAGSAEAPSSTHPAAALRPGAAPWLAGRLQTRRPGGAGACRGAAGGLGAAARPAAACRRAWGALRRWRRRPGARATPPYFADCAAARSIERSARREFRKRAPLCGQLFAGGFVRGACALLCARAPSPPLHHARGEAARCSSHQAAAVLRVCFPAPRVQAARSGRPVPAADPPCRVAAARCASRGGG